MKKIFFILFIASVLISCKDSKAIEKEEKVEVADTLSVEETTSKESIPKAETSEEEVEFKNDFEILLASQYRDWEGKNKANSLTKDWVDLYEKSGRYYLGKADFKLENGYSECTGDSTKVLNSKYKTVLFMDFPELKLGEIKSLKIEKNKVWPKQKISFAFNNVEYFLRAEGEVPSSFKVGNDNGKEETFTNIKKYKLYISTKEMPEKLLLKESSFNDTFVELLFIGDIDKDGKPDFIIGANRNYEEERVILFLSSKAEKEHIVKKVSEIAIQFDC